MCQADLNDTVWTIRWRKWNYGEWIYFIREYKQAQLKLWGLLSDYLTSEFNESSQPEPEISQCQNNKCGKSPSEAVNAVTWWKKKLVP